MRPSFNNGVTPEQIAEAKKLDLYSYLSLYEPDELVHVAGNEYCTRTHGSLKISNGRWNWFSQGVGGRTALDYLIKVCGLSFVNAVKQLCGTAISSPAPVTVLSDQTKPNKPPFVLPEANFTNNIVVDYLCNKRGLPKELVLSCINKNLIYESREHHNAVFVGYDKEGIPRFAMLRGCYDKPFKKDVEGSNKAVNFSIPATSTQADVLCVFESAIEALSFGAIKNLDRECIHLLALSGVAPPKSKETTMKKLPIALERYLSDYPNVKQVVLGLNNDAAGRKATLEIQRLLHERGYEVHDMPPALGKDYNEELLARRALQQTKQQCR